MYKQFRSLESRDSKKEVLLEIHNPRILKSILVSPNLERTAFVDVQKKGLFKTISRIVMNGNYGKFHDSIILCSFSADSEHFSYWAKEGNEELVVIDGKEEGRFKRVGPPVLSPDGMHIAFTAMREKKWFVVLDGNEGPEYDVVDRNIIFSPDSKKCAYRASNAGKQLVIPDFPYGLTRAL